jgi:uncharacterized protein YndB with AHSA1/START domain
MTRSLTVERTVPAPPEQVWPAWTTAEGLAGWWWQHLPGTTYEIDARVGGTYRITSPAAGIGVHGAYLDIDEPHAFAATFIWIDDGVDAPTEHITVTLAAHPSGTTITIVHSGDWTDDDAATKYAAGWNDTIDHLVRTAASLGAPAS